MSVQDDHREIELIDLFQLSRPAGGGRGDTDAVLHLDGQTIEFELKSTTRGSVTTVRDFGQEHITKWAQKHWIIGFYAGQGKHLALTHCVYASPAQMAPWISEKELYISVDFGLSALVPERITLGDLYATLGEKPEYTLSDAMSLQKRQLTKLQYLELVDLPEDRYSPTRMLEILRDRCRYLIRRGSTLNNPHIPQSYFSEMQVIKEHHATTLIELVRQELRASSTERAT